MLGDARLFGRGVGGIRAPLAIGLKKPLPAGVADGASRLARLNEAGIAAPTDDANALSRYTLAEALGSDASDIALALRAVAKRGRTSLHARSCFDCRRPRGPDLRCECEAAWGARRRVGCAVVPRSCVVGRALSSWRA